MKQPQYEQRAVYDCKAHAQKDSKSVMPACHLGKAVFHFEKANGGKRSNSASLQDSRHGKTIEASSLAPSHPFLVSYQRRSAPRKQDKWRLSLSYFFLFFSFFGRHISDTRQRRSKAWVFLTDAMLLSFQLVQTLPLRVGCYLRSSTTHQFSLSKYDALIVTGTPSSPSALADASVHSRSSSPSEKKW